MGQSHLISKVGQRGQLQESSTVGHVVDQRNQLAAPDLELGTGRRVVRLDKARQSFEPIQVKVSVTANQAVGGWNEGIVTVGALARTCGKLYSNLNHVRVRNFVLGGAPLRSQSLVQRAATTHITHQIATWSECRYRWLRVPATTFVITRSPSRFNRRDGGGFAAAAATE